MKDYNKILESVRKGISLALDDFDFNDNEEEIKPKKVGKYREVKTHNLIIKEFFDDIKNENITKDDLQLLYTLYPLSKLRYKVKDEKELKGLIVYIISIDKEADLNWIDISKVNDLSNLFAHSEFNGDISKWTTSKVTRMAGLFTYSHFDGDISNWDTSNVEDMNYMFSICPFNGDISKWNTSKVRTMAHMFEISPFDQDISKWNTSNVKSMKYMFRSSLFNGDISNWDVSKVENTLGMFEEAKFAGDISKWKLEKATTTDFMFTDSKFDGDLSLWDGRSFSLKTFYDSNISNEHLPKFWETKNKKLD